MLSSYRLNNFRFTYPTIDRIAHVNTPILLLHGENDNKVPYSMSVSLFNQFIHSNSLKLSSSSIATVDQLYGYNDNDSSGGNSRNDDYTVYPCTIKNVTCFYSDDKRSRISSSSSSSSRSGHGCSNMIRYYKLPLSSHNDNHRSQLWSNTISQFFNHVEKC